MLWFCNVMFRQTKTIPEELKKTVVDVFFFATVYVVTRMTWNILELAGQGFLDIL